MKQIKVTLRPDGTQTIEVLGAVGDECLAWTRELEQRLGRQDGERLLKPQFETTDRETEHEKELER